LIPNFLIAGGVASGTSFLSSALMHHPEIYLPKVQRPEPNFFHYTWKFSKGISWYQDSWFQEVGNQKAVGERSSLLLSSKVAARKIRQTFKQIKLVFCLRNPIERAWGNYRFTVLEGLETLSFEQAINTEHERIKKAAGKWAEVQPHAYINRGYYSERIKEYLNLFGRENILILKSEELGDDPHGNFQRVCRFLGVDPSVELPVPPKYTSPSVKDRLLQAELRDYFGDRFSLFVEHIRKGKDAQTLVNGDMDYKNFTRLKSNLEFKKVTLSDETRQQLRLIFEEDIRRLQDIVDFPVDDWS